jgi:xanthine dehydrogenase accessory factor
MRRQHSIASLLLIFPRYESSGDTCYFKLFVLSLSPIMFDWPKLITFALNHRSQRFALATLVEREGSSYRRPGARMIIADDGVYAGCISGGCLEEEIADAAIRVLQTGQTRLYTVDTRPHYGCPGRLHIFIEEFSLSMIDAIHWEIIARAPFDLLTTYASVDGSEKGTQLTHRNHSVQFGQFLEVAGRKPRLLIVSGTSDANSVRQLGNFLGWHVHQIIPDGATSDNVDSYDCITCSAGDFVNRFSPDEMTAVLIMTHHLSRDLQYLRQVLPEPYAYVGLLGSRQRRETLLAEIGESGIFEDESVSERLFAPAGLDIGASDPAAIALSIISEIQAVWEKRNGGSLRDRLGSIHETRYPSYA